MSPITAVASLLLSAQAPVPPDQAELAQCLAAFVAAQQQAGAEVLDFTNALGTACHQEERAYRLNHIARATAAGAGYVPADSEAYQNVLNLRNGYRDAYLAARQTCARPGRRR